jgi:hypothetical protein
MLLYQRDLACFTVSSWRQRPSISEESVLALPGNPVSPFPPSPV